MTRANVPRQQGDDFQARMFWLHASRLLDPESPVLKVAYETGPRAFDDIYVEYDPVGAPPDHEGKPILRKHIQCKWHAVAGTFGYADLTDPAFINANQHSLLERARAAQRACGGPGCAFEFITNWRIKAEDPLLSLVRKQTNAIDLDRLMRGATAKSETGRVRKAWRDHLEVTEEALLEVVRCLAIAEHSESLDDLRERLDDRFFAVGMRRVPASQSSFFYDDLARKLLAQGRVEFDRDGFRRLCEGEGLLAETDEVEHVRTIGVRSFMHPIDALDARCDELLNLVPYFDLRYMRKEEDWQRRVLPELRTFLAGEARSHDRLRLILDAHASLAFAAGSALNVKSGKSIEIEQRTSGRRFWSATDQAPDAAWAHLGFARVDVSRGQPDLAVAVGLTHDVAPAVERYLESTAGGVGLLLQCRPQDAPGQHSVQCGRHAWELAESVVREVARLRAESEVTGKIHLFVAAPNGFTFFLGQQSQVLGRVAMYEFDFGGARGGGYQLGIELDG
ncbi:MAG: SAVED domain-containing protein [Myxococcota bacterium]